MRFRTRYLLAVTLVAAMLCVDQGAAVASTKVEPAPSRGLVDRLTESLRRTVVPRAVVRPQSPFAVALTATPPVLRRAVPVAPPPACPSHLPLPPPVG